MEKKFWLLTTSTCSNCPKVKNIIEQDPELLAVVEYKDAMEHKDLCIEKQIRSVPTLYNTQTGEVFSVGMSSKEEITNIIKGS